MKAVLIKAFGALTLAGAASCAPDDSDRCHGRYYWDAKTSACLERTDSETASSADGDTDADTETDSGAGVNADGFWNKCTPKGGECQAFENANYCMLQYPPSTAQQGFCSITECSIDDSASCPSNAHCCVLEDKYASLYESPICLEHDFACGFFALMCKNKQPGACD